MLKTRIIPSLTVKDGSLVKTCKFKNAKYLGDPINTVRILSQKKASELVLLDITEGQSTPNYKLVEDIAEEAQMPLSYGGKIKNISDARQLFKLGIERLVVNELALSNPSLLREIINYAGAASIVVTLNVGTTLSGEIQLYSSDGKECLKGQLYEYIEKINGYGVGEILVCDVNNEGTSNGLNINLVSFFSNELSAPFLISGGCSGLTDAKYAIINGADGVVASSLFVLYGKNKSSLITYNVPDDF